MDTPHIRHEECHTTLAQRMEQVVTSAAPLVEKATGLLMPQIMFRLVSVEEFARDYSAFVERQLSRDTKELVLTMWQQSQVRSLPQTVAFSARSMWRFEEPVLIVNSLGAPITLFVPDALEYQGLSDAPDLLAEQIVRELTRQAQSAAGGGLLLPAPAWPVVRPACHALTVLSDGHALWTSARVVPELLGRPVDHTLRRRYNGRLLQRLSFRFADRGGAKRRREAAAFVDQAVNAIGTAEFNKVWSVPGRAPTLRELRAPSDWLTRVSVGPPGASAGAACSF